MELLCPDVGGLSTCYSCNDQCPPPYRLCLVGHLACVPCATFRRRCECGKGFAIGPHLSYDWLLSAMDHRCKYRVAAAWRDLPVAGDADGGCPDRWYTVQQLRDHYRGSCSRNTFACPVVGCGHACRIDTATEHYESAHGPFEMGRPDHLRPNAVTIIMSYNTESIKKMFNGYFALTVGSKSTVEMPFTQTSMTNINPADMLKYEYDLRIHDHNQVIFTVMVRSNLLAEKNPTAEIPSHTFHFLPTQ